MKKIFINYSWKHHSKKADDLFSTLSGYKGFDLWMDKKSLQGGVRWRPAIRKAIRESDFFISLLSKKSITGRGERNKEIDQALDVLKEFPPDEVYLIPTLIDKCKPPFEEMNELNWVKLFPSWNSGVDDLLWALGKKKPVKKILKEETAKELSSKYHYRVGIVDLDIGLVNLQKVISQLNRVQNYFLFTLPRMPVLRGVTETFKGSKNFAVFKVPQSYIAEHRHLNVDLVACITKYPLAFERPEKFEYDNFAGSSDEDERFMFVSADNLRRYCRKAKCSFEEGLVYILIGQLVNYFTDIDYHDETRACVMDYCEDRDDVVYGLRTQTFCKECRKKIPEGELKQSLFKLLDWRYGE